MNVKIKKLHENAVIPTKATDGSAGYDLYCPMNTTVEPGRGIIPLGFSIELPFGYEASIQPRSGYSSKGFQIMLPPVCDKAGTSITGEASLRADIDVLIGVVDSDYRGEIGVIVKSNEPVSRTVLGGQRIAQMLIRKVETVEFEETDELTGSGRNDGGFGSTGSL